MEERSATMLRKNITLPELLQIAEEKGLSYELTQALSLSVIANQSLQRISQPIPPELLEPPPGAGHGAYAG